ncbi:MAG: hypothetical protein ABWZ02_10230 [Nakamurella sp.]
MTNIQTAPYATDSTTPPGPDGQPQDNIDQRPPPAEPAVPRPPRRRRRPGLGIQSKLLIMLSAVSLVSAGVVGVVGYFNGRASLQAAAFNQLTTIREMRADAIERELGDLQQGVVLDSRNTSAVEGATAFIDAFAQLQNSTLTAEQDAKLTNFYAGRVRAGGGRKIRFGLRARSFHPGNPGRPLSAGELRRRSAIRRLRHRFGAVRCR